MLYRNKVSYEWVAELVDENNDIEDTYYGEGLEDVLDYFEKGSFRVALICNIGNEADGLQDRFYVYLTDGAIPKTFGNMRKVPLRYLKEVEKFYA